MGTRTKLDENADKQTDEADHTVDKSSAKEAKATKAAKDAQLRKDWANPDFVELVNDNQLMKQLESICRRLTDRFRPTFSYPWDDLMSDVIDHVVVGLPYFRHESKLTTWFYRIARNRMVDLSRKKENKAPSMHGTKLRDRNGEEYEVDREATEGGEPSDTHHKHVEDQQHRSILLDKLMGTLSDQECSLCFKYYVEGRTMDEIAKEEGRTRQAVCNQFGRLKKKLRKHL